MLEYAELELPAVIPQKDIRQKISDSLSPRVAYRLTIQPELPLEYYFILYSELVKNCSELAVQIAPKKYLVLFSHVLSGEYTHHENYLLFPELVHQSVAQFTDQLIDHWEVNLAQAEKITAENCAEQLKRIKAMAHWTVTLQFTGETDPLTALVYLAVLSGYAQIVQYHQMSIL